MICNMHEGHQLYKSIRSQHFFKEASKILELIKDVSKDKVHIFSPLILFNGECIVIIGSSRICPIDLQ